MTRRRSGPLTRARLASRLIGLASLLAAALLVGLANGAGEVSLARWLPWTPPLDPIERAILIDVRLPRVLLAALVGGALTVAGVAFQALLRNPLADPYVLGVSGGASLGGVVAVVLGVGGSGALAGLGVPAFAFGGALGALLLIERIATIGGRLTVYTVLLTGAIFNATTAAGIYLIQSLASLEELHAIVFYLMGHIPSLPLAALALLAPVLILGVLALWSLARSFNALALGEEGATQVGVDVRRVKRQTILLGSLITALAVSLAGLIGFVGLIVPHLLRLALGPDHRLLIPAGFLCGAAFLVLADLIARVLVLPAELPVGVVTALIGGPFFLMLLRSHRGAHGFA